MIGAKDLVAVSLAIFLGIVSASFGYGLVLSARLGRIGKPYRYGGRLGFAAVGLGRPAQDLRPWRDRLGGPSLKRAEKTETVIWIEAGTHTARRGCVAWPHRPRGHIAYVGPACKRPAAGGGTMLRRHLTMALSALASGLFAGGCGGDGHNDRMMYGPSGVPPVPGSASLMSVSPAGGSVGIPTTTLITIHFGAGMAAGMEQYVDLHSGDLAGPTVPLHCSWSGDRIVLTCTPDAPLRSQTTYWVHLGGGLMTQGGQRLDYDQYGPMMGGQWIMGGLMGAGFHAGSAWGMMRGYWQNPNGAYGMAFPFTTA